MNAVKVTSTAETFRNVEDGMCRWTYSIDVVCSALSCDGVSGAANPFSEETNPSNIMNCGCLSGRRWGAQFCESSSRGTDLDLLVVRHWILRILRILTVG